ncbi:response regulator [Alteromonas sp. 5E99-2]|uniref:response regulator n=1 Tax=Alteromonas sp. 5E99-2 TaxID=2817683 RepID=UPI001A99CDC4|nr:response regulator [Alteromonas sp. 5E99-2]MBO1254618.1 response regulator [Alteromonas sp. 5E99-2]
MAKATILIIDDDAELTSMLEEYLSSMDFDVVVTSDGEEGLAHALSDHSFDMILLDVMMPKKDGFEVLKSLRETKVTPVIMLTARGDDYDRVLGLEFGADDYLPKPFNHRELIARINAIIRRRTQYDDKAANSEITAGEITINVASHSAHYCSEQLNLTGTEFATLKLLAQNHGTLVSKNQISEDVLGKKLMEYDRSIDMHVSNIRKKMSTINEENKIKTVRGAGYILLCD